MKFPIVAFILSIVCGIILPLCDIGSDTYLFYNTMLFKGESLLMAGCRTCYDELNGKDYSTANTCDVCSTDGHTSIGGIACGMIPSALDTMTRLIKNDLCLENKTWSVKNEWNGTFEQRDACEPGDHCCIITKAKGSRDGVASDINTILPDSVNWYGCNHYNHGECEWCIGVGASTYDSCKELIMGDNNMFNIYASCTNGYYVASNRSKHFVKEKGCTSRDECCVKISDKKLFGDRMFRCNDTCKLHITSLSSTSRKIYDLNSWHSHTAEVHMLGGGERCGIYRMHGYCLLLPTLFNWVFVLNLWINDYTKQKTGLYTLIFGVTMTYPIILVVKYLCLWKDIKQMEEQKEIFERDVATAEGCLESLIQVNNYLLIFSITRILIFISQHSVACTNF